ncbi:hypothetical protein HBN50_00205 [Halobacteriovorax sp. GB3]|nr:hypothetical protein [Halobacteriovorax sp. GB3]
MERILFQEECENNISYLPSVDEYSVDCGMEFHHYNSEAAEDYYSSFDDDPVKLGTWNVFHPGIGKSQFKDYSLVAEIMNRWDIVTAVELLPLIGADSRHNESVISYLRETPRKINDLKKELNATNPSTKAYEKLKAELKEAQDGLKKAKGLYRSPGYLKILKELRKIDPSWALILSPRGEGSDGSWINELVGFYYRGRKVKPIENEHCEAFQSTLTASDAYACFPDITGKFLYRNYEGLFSRRPFMGSFKSGEFDFTLIGSHIIHNSPDDSDLMKTLLNKTFGVDHYDDLGEGVDSGNYARFAEIKMTFEIIKNLKRKYKEQDVIYTGDFNVEADEPLLKKMMSEYEGMKVLVRSETSLSNQRFDSSGEGNGYSNNYDHFFVDSNKLGECKMGSLFTSRRVDFYKGFINDLMQKYLIRDIDGVSHLKTLYPMSDSGKKKMNREVTRFKNYLDSQLTIKRNKIVPVYTDSATRVDAFRRRVFESQLDDDFFYGVYKEILSDHAPIEITCSTEEDDD